jgi:hypothetical protein
MLKYYEDLSPYEYYMPCPIPEVRNVGWLDKEHPFLTGKPDLNFLKKLEDLIFNSYRGSCNIFVNKLRGAYDCPICGKNELIISNDHNEFVLGSSELWIPDCGAEGNYFATFGLIIHHIMDHQYQPPKEFIDSVLLLDLNKKFNGDDTRDSLIDKCYSKK